MARWLALGAWLGVCGVLLLCGAWAQEQARPRLVGAPLEARMDADAEQALQFAVEQYNRASNDAFRSRVAEVVSLHKQVSAGPGGGRGCAAQWPQWPLPPGGFWRSLARAMAFQAAEVGSPGAEGCLALVGIVPC